MANSATAETDLHLTGGMVGASMFVSFEDWTKGRSIASFGTNAGADELPFQTWRHFKEAFAPELIAQALVDSEIPVASCLDPFGGSGTTALACQFLGVTPTTAEVNPFLGDLIQAKLETYDSDLLANDLGRIASAVSVDQGDLQVLGHLPPTFVEPGINGRWIFDAEIAARIAAIFSAILSLENIKHRTLFKVLLGGRLVELSNVVISGKGRRYRRSWGSKRRDPLEVDELFFAACQTAISDIHRHARRKVSDYKLVRGDSRIALAGHGPWDLAVFSPPYPNSFDYTDVYNVELWMLGYLNGTTANRVLRESTLTSHVQVSRAFEKHPSGSPDLDTAMVQLVDKRSELWDRRIPEMVGGYFADMLKILDVTGTSLSAGGSCWIVIGDSRYAGVHIGSATILAQLAADLGWEVVGNEPFRSMRLSPQQGGNAELSETLLKLRKRE